MTDMKEMTPLQPDGAPEKKGAVKRNASFPLSAKTLLAAGAFVGAVVIGMSLYGNLGFSIFPHQTDNLTESQRQERLEAFNAIGIIHLAIVPEKDREKAIESMQLSSEARASLQVDLGKTPALAPQTTGGQSASQAPLSPQPAGNQSSAKAGSADAEQPGPALAPAKARQMQLAWITLWDSDVEDGDMVRIDSEGYSRTVYLRNKPVTFAVPVPANGIISVTGIRDGDGGGITVGLGSGAVKAILPIMSVGQVLPLRVGVF